MNETPQYSTAWEVPLPENPRAELLGLLHVINSALTGTPDGWLENVGYDIERQAVQVRTRNPYQFEVGSSIALSRTDGITRSEKISFIGDSIRGEELMAQLWEGKIDGLKSMSPDTQFRVLYSLIAAEVQSRKK
jgi:hypothetical protein